MMSLIQRREARFAVQDVCAAAIEWEKHFAFVSKQTRILEDETLRRENAYWPALLQKAAMTPNPNRKPGTEVYLTIQDYVIRTKGIMFGALMLSETPRKVCIDLICGLASSQTKGSVKCFGSKEIMFEQCLKACENDLTTMDADFGLSVQAIQGLHNLCNVFSERHDIEIDLYRDFLNKVLVLTRNLQPKVLLDMESKKGFLQNCLSHPALSKGLRNNNTRLIAMWGIVDLLSDSKLRFKSRFKIAKGLVIGMDSAFVAQLNNCLGLDVERLYQRLDDLQELDTPLRKLKDAFLRIQEIGTSHRYDTCFGKTLNYHDAPVQLHTKMNQCMSKDFEIPSTGLEVAWQIIQSEILSSEHTFSRLPALIRRWIFPPRDKEILRTSLHIEILHRLIALGKDTSLFDDICAVLVQAWIGYGSGPYTFANDSHASLCETLTLRQFEGKVDERPDFFRIRMIAELVHSVNKSPLITAAAKEEGVREWYKIMTEKRPDIKDALFHPEGVPERHLDLLQSSFGIRIEDRNERPAKRARIDPHVELECVPAELRKSWRQGGDDEVLSQEFMSFLQNQLSVDWVDAKLWEQWAAAHDAEVAQGELRFMVKVLMFLLGIHRRAAPDTSPVALGNEKQREILLRLNFPHGVGSTITSQESLKHWQLNSLMTALFRETIGRRVIFQGDFDLWSSVSGLPEVEQVIIRHQIELELVEGPKLRSCDVEKVFGMGEVKQRGFWSLISSSYFNATSKQLLDFLRSVFKAAKEFPKDHSGVGFSMLQLQVEILCLQRTECALDIIELFCLVPKSFARLYSSIFHMWICRQDFGPDYTPNEIIAKQKSQVTGLDIITCSDKANVICALEELLAVFTKRRQPAEAIEAKIREFKRTD